MPPRSSTNASHLFEESVRQSRKTLALDPNFAVGHFQLAEALVQEHQYAAAIAEFQRAIELSGHLAAFDANLLRSDARFQELSRRIGLQR
jgi:cytochrome c-type biogenesis protein CcmH/NrfG